MYYSNFDSVHHSDLSLYNSQLYTMRSYTFPRSTNSWRDLVVTNSRQTLYVVPQNCLHPISSLASNVFLQACDRFQLCSDVGLGLSCGIVSITFGTRRYSCTAWPLLPTTIGPLFINNFINPFVPNFYFAHFWNVCTGSAAFSLAFFPTPCGLTCLGRRQVTLMFPDRLLKCLSGPPHFQYLLGGTRQYLAIWPILLQR